MKTFASILLLLASGQAAGQSAKAVKQEMSVASIELLGSVSTEAIDIPEANIELPGVIELSGAKSAKAKAGKAKSGKMGDAKAEKESSSKAAKLFKGGAKSSKAYDAKAGKESSASSKSAKSFDSKSVKSRRLLDADGSGDHSMSLDLAAIELPAIDLPVSEVAATVSAKALKTSAYSKTSKGSYSAKSSKAQPKRRSIDPAMSNDSDPVKALSFIDYARAQAPESAELEGSSAGALSVATIVLLPLAAAVAHLY